MKLALVSICILGLVTPIISQDWLNEYRDQRELVPGSYDQPWPESHTNPERRSLQLPGWISKWIPNWSNVFSVTINVLAGMPAKFVSSTINRVCSLAVYTGLLKPSYVPPQNRLSWEFFTDNNVAEIPLNDIEDLVNQSGFNSAYNVTIFVSGWEANTDPASPNNIVHIITQAYKQRQNHNLVVFNVGEFVGNLFNWATFDTSKVGGILGDALTQLIQRIPIGNIHLVGHGLGAHIVGAAGRRVHEVTGQQFPRITGLDPTMVCYDETYGLNSIRKGDAAFVDVIHSNNGVLGKSEPIGDADFFPNGPIALPPGCLDIVCAHNRAVHYYAESVVPGSEENLMAAKCPSIKDYKQNKCHTKKIPMGFLTPTSIRGSYFLVTNSRSPYGQNSDANQSGNIWQSNSSQPNNADTQGPSNGSGENQVNPQANPNEEDNTNQLNNNNEQANPNEEANVSANDQNVPNEDANVSAGDQNAPNDEENQA